MQWNDFAQRLSQPPFDTLSGHFGLHEYTDWPGIDDLNQLAQTHQPDFRYRFVDDNGCAEDTRYYEQIIADTQQIPTRLNNWHDLFNALVWLSFPRTKQAINHQHMEDINRHGLNPRTARRDRLTHFDECGVILAVNDDRVTGSLAQHEWTQGFVNQRQAWYQDLLPLVFGHANYEMLLKPFEGLTGKWFAVHVQPSFFTQHYAQQLQTIDGLMSKAVLQDNVFSTPCLKPLPLLGVPTWWAANEQPGFYDNRQYFRPKRRS